MAKKAPRIRRTFTPQFKKDAVALVEAGRTVNEVAHDLGIAANPAPPRNPRNYARFNRSCATSRRSGTS